MYIHLPAALNAARGSELRKRDVGDRRFMIYRHLDKKNQACDFCIQLRPFQRAFHLARNAPALDV